MEKGKSLLSTSRAVTMRDVARAAQVSQSTVSRVLSAGELSSSVPISAETIERVNSAVQALGYHPNLHARSLRGQKTQMIAMMLADIQNPYYHVMVRRIQDIARKHGYDMLISNTDHDPELEQHFLEGIKRRPVDGVVLTPYHLKQHDVEDLINRTGVKVVMVGQHMTPPTVDTVYADDESATCDAIRWLIRERGHTRIAYLGVPGTHPDKRRRAGFATAMAEAGLSVPAAYFETGDFEVESGARAALRLLALPEPPSAVFACNDLMALGCVTAAQQFGVKVPEKLAVIGFDDIPEASRVSPKLTTVAQYPAEMGERLANALFERIQADEDLPRRSFQVPLRLIVRESA
jgi:DNA-binding LacI/PurR family transcriptional regulator